MPGVIFIHPDNHSEKINVVFGDTVMQVATGNGVGGIVAECGGNVVCGTCHVYVDQNWITKLATISSEEDNLLEGVAAERLSNSRLSCQITITPELDGLIVRLPERQN